MCLLFLAQPWDFIILLCEKFGYEMGAWFFFLFVAFWIIKVLYLDIRKKIIEIDESLKKFVKILNEVQVTKVKKDAFEEIIRSLAEEIKKNRKEVCEVRQVSEKNHISLTGRLKGISDDVDNCLDKVFTLAEKISELLGHVISKR